MTVKEANKWLDKVQNIIDNMYKIQEKCSSGEENAYWRDFADYCELNVGVDAFTGTTIDALLALKGLFKEKIDNLEVK